MNKIININFLFFFLFFVNIADATEKPPFENITVTNKNKIYKKIYYEDFEGNIVNLNNISSKIYLLNFWATWCAPCKDEMPSLDELQEISDIEVITINIEKKNHKKTKKFFQNLKIKNLSIYLDNKNYLVNLFDLRGLHISLIHIIHFRRLIR